MRSCCKKWKDLLSEADARYAKQEQLTKKCIGMVCDLLRHIARDPDAELPDDLRALLNERLKR